jgi:hypothetical protein
MVLVLGAKLCRKGVVCKFVLFDAVPRSEKLTIEPSGFFVVAHLVMPER